MKIALDITPLSSGHRFRGIGSYTNNLVKALKQFDKKNSYIFFTRAESAPNNIDLVHYPYFEPFFLTLPWRKVAKTVVTIHDLIPLLFPEKFPPGIKGKIKWEIQKISLKGVKAIITDSENSKKDIVKVTGFPRERVYVIYLAPGPEFKELEIEKFKSEIKQKYRLPDVFILYVGDVTWNKNIPGLISAIEQIGIPLVIVGKQAGEKQFDQGHPENKDLVFLQRKAERDEKIIRMGFVPAGDLVAIYNLATVYCQPSFYEGFGLPVLEAMACGTPVIAANTSSLPEITAEAAILVNPYNIKNITEGLRKVLGFYTSDKSRYRQLQLKGLIQAKKFTWERVVRETIAVYKKILRH